jgi:hypothetical protein
VDEVVWGCLGNGYSDDRKMYGLPMGASKCYPQAFHGDEKVGS